MAKWRTIQRIDYYQPRTRLAVESVGDAVPRSGWVDYVPDFKEDGSYGGWHVGRGVEQYFAESIYRLYPGWEVIDSNPEVIIRR